MHIPGSLVSIFFKSPQKSAYLWSTFKVNSQEAQSQVNYIILW
jgi:hypothetical protein